MAINDNLKAKIDELDLDKRLEEVTAMTQKALEEAKRHAGVLARDNRERVDQWLTKAGKAVDQRTDGKYHDKFEKFAASVGGIVDKVAEQPAAPGAHRDDPAWRPDHEDISHPTPTPFPRETYPMAEEGGSFTAPTSEAPVDATMPFNHENGRHGSAAPSETYPMAEEGGAFTSAAGTWAQESHADVPEVEPPQAPVPEVQASETDQDAWRLATDDGMPPPDEPGEPERD